MEAVYESATAVSINWARRTEKTRFGERAIYKQTWHSSLGEQRGHDNEK